MYILSHQPIIRQVMLGVLCALGVLTAPAVQADDVNAVTNNNQINIPAFGGNVTLLQTTIFTPGPRELVIHFFAECQVVASDNSTFIDLDILVNGVEVPPTNDGNSALCNSPDQDMSVGTVVFRSVVAGNHTILVRGSLAGTPAAGEVGQVDDRSLVIEEEAP
jgi:hypothetical protein